MKWNANSSLSIKWNFETTTNRWLITLISTTSFNNILTEEFFLSLFVIVILYTKFDSLFIRLLFLKTCEFFFSKNFFFRLFDDVDVCFHLSIFRDIKTFNRIIFLLFTVITSNLRNWFFFDFLFSCLNFSSADWVLFFFMFEKLATSILKIFKRSLNVVVTLSWRLMLIFNLIAKVIRFFFCRKYSESSSAQLLMRILIW